MTPAVEFIDVTKRFPGAASPALDHVSLAIVPGELVCVLGTSGGGKTTFFKLVTRVLVVDGGRVQHYAEPQELLTHPATPFVRELLATQGSGGDGPLPHAAMGGEGRA